MCVNISSIKRICSNKSRYFPDVHCIPEKIMVFFRYHFNKMFEVGSLGMRWQHIDLAIGWIIRGLIPSRVRAFSRPQNVQILSVTHPAAPPPWGIKRSKCEADHSPLHRARPGVNSAAPRLPHTASQRAQGQAFFGLLITAYGFILPFNWYSVINWPHNKAYPQLFCCLTPFRSKYSHKHIIVSV